MKKIYLIACISLISFIVNAQPEIESLLIPGFKAPASILSNIPNYNATSPDYGNVDPSTIIPEYMIRDILAKYGLLEEFQETIGTTISTTIIVNDIEYETNEPFQYLYGYNYNYGFNYLTGPIYYNIYGQGIQYIYTPEGISMRIY
jgi:hypothetical protein